MAEVWAAATATVVVGAYSANQQKKAAQGASNAAAAGAATEVAERQRQFDLTRADQMPWLNAGNSALLQMQKLNGGDFSSFTESPDYAFARDQGLMALERGASARGSMYSGGADADRMAFASGLASQNYGQYYNRLAGLAGGGQATASGLGSLGMGMANQNAGSIGNATAARQSAYGARADANSQLAAGIGGAFNNWMQSRQPATNAGYTGNGTGVGSLSNFGNNTGLLNGGDY